MSFLDYLNEALKSYDIYDYKLDKFRSVYRVSTKNNVFLIKSFNSKIKLFNTKKILCHLKNNGFDLCQTIKYNTNNEFFFEFNGKYYSCFSWINGRETNLKRQSEIKKSIKSIYLFHKSVKYIQDSSIILKDNSNWIKTFENDLLSLYYIKNIILGKSPWSLLDSFYYENLSKALNILHKILDELNKNYIRNYLHESKIICHNSLYYQNLILYKKHVYLIDFGGITINNPIYDLSRFCRRVFYKNNFDLQIFEMIYNTYKIYYDFGNFENLLFNILMKYPYKFIKLGVKFYIKNKPLKEILVLKKLKKYSRYELSN